MPGLFLSYRREEAAAETRLLYSSLEMRLGVGSVFMDVNDIPLGQDFRKEIEMRIDNCDAVLVVIGRHWLSERLYKESDCVRREIAAGRGTRAPANGKRPAAQSPASPAQF